MKRGASAPERGTRRQKTVNKTDLMEDLVIALGEAHMLSEREVRENSSCVKATILFYRDEVGNFPDWAQEGATEFGHWLKEVDDRVGEDVGSPHVRVGVKSLLALINSPQLKDVKLQEKEEKLFAWWTNKVEKEENLKDIVREIGGDIKNGPAPRNKATKRVQQLLRQAKLRGK